MEACSFLSTLFVLFQSLHSYKKPFEVSVPEDFFEKLQSMNFSKDDSSEKLGSLFRIRSFRGSGEGGRLPFSRVSMLSVSKSSLLSDLWSLHIGTFLVFLGFCFSSPNPSKHHLLWRGT